MEAQDLLGEAIHGTMLPLVFGVGLMIVGVPLVLVGIGWLGRRLFDRERKMWPNALFELTVIALGLTAVVFGWPLFADHSGGLFGSVPS